MKKILLSLCAMLCISLGYAQQDTVLMSYTIKPGLSNTDTMLIYMRSKTSNTIPVFGVDLSMLFQGACADTGNGFYYSYFEAQWTFPFIQRNVDLLPSSVVRDGVTYSARQLYGVAGLFEPAVILPNNSITPGVLAFKFPYIGACSDTLYLQNSSEDPFAAVTSPPPSSNAIPFQIVKFDYVSLPVTYSFFQAKALNPQKVQLSWETTLEINNDYFSIEKSYSSAPEAFVEVGQVQGVGFSDAPQAYRFTDESPMSSVVYYRLKQVDLDGTSSYSNTVQVHFGTDPELFVDLYPNPAQGQTHLRVQGPEGEALPVQVSNLAGQIVHQQVLSLESSGYAEITIELGDLPAGFYLVSVQEPQTGRWTTRKLMLQ